MNDILKVFTKNNIEILKLITKYDNLYLREIAEKTRSSPALVHQSITLFKKLNFVREESFKNKKIIIANRNNSILKKIKSVINIYEMQNNKNFKILKKYGKIGIYGSFANGEDTAESDIDLWLYSDKKINKIEIRHIIRKTEKSLEKEVRLLILNDNKIKMLREKDPEFYFRLKLTSVGEDIFG